MASAGGAALPNPFNVLPTKPHLRFFASCADDSRRGTAEVKGYLAANPNLINESMEYLDELNKGVVLEMWTALHYAAAAPNSQTLEALLEAPGADDILNNQSVREMNYSYDRTSHRFPKGCTALHVVCLIPRWKHLDELDEQKRIIELLVNAGIDTTLTADGKTAEKYLINPELIEHLKKCIGVKKNTNELAPPFYNESGALLHPGGRKFPFLKNYAEARMATPALLNRNAASRTKTAWFNSKASGVNTVLKGSPPQEAINSEVGIVMKQYEGLISSYAGELHKKNGKNAVEAKRKNTRKIIETAVRKGLNSNTRATMLSDLENLWNPTAEGGARRRKTRKTRKSKNRSKNRKSNKLRK